MEAALVQEIPVKDVHKSPFQPRHDRENAFAGPKFDELVESVKARGVIEPIIVRHRSVEGMPAFELIIGERRLRAAQVARLENISAILRPMEDAEVILLQLVENYHREDLDPIEKAEAVQRALSLQDEASGKPLYTQTELAKELGIAQPTLANMLRLLKLPEPVKEQVSASTHGAGEGERALSPAHAQVLIPFGQYPWIMDAVQKRYREEGLPPAKEFAEFVIDVLFVQETTDTMLVRPLSEGYFFGSRHLEFSPKAKGLPRDWSQLEDYRLVVADLKEHPDMDPEKPGPGPCTDCPHIRVIPHSRYGGKEEKTFCMLTKCWEGKQKAHKAAERQAEAAAPQTAARLATLKEDPKRVNLGALKSTEFCYLTRGKDMQIQEYTWKDRAPLWDIVPTCKEACPFKFTDGHPAYRQGFLLKQGKILSPGAVCLNPKHYEQLQKQAAEQRVKAWREGTIARLKGLVKKAEKGLDAHDLVDLLLESLDFDIHMADTSPIGRLAGYDKTRLAATELLQMIFGIKGAGMQKQALARRPRKELEGYLKFALELRADRKLNR